MTSCCGNQDKLRPDGPLGLYTDFTFCSFAFSREPLADFHDAKHTTRSMYLDLTKGRLLTCGGDRIVKVSICNCLQNVIEFKCCKSLLSINSS